ncbi:hypothetical protein HD554DRAFT_2018677, partial [Boletus coccyginus]
NHLSFKVGVIDHLGYSMFTINHFNGSVIYSSEGFLNHNLDSLNLDFVFLLHNSIVGVTDSAEEAGSFKSFTKGLFSSMAITIQAHPKNKDTCSSQSSQCTTLSTCCKGTIK